MEKVYVGIDIAKDSLDVAVHASDKQWRYSNDPAGITSLCKMLVELSPTLVVFEATGGYEMPLYLSLDEVGLPAAPVNARQIRDFARSTGKLAKTDSLDARVIGTAVIYLSCREEDKLLVEKFGNDYTEYI